MREGEDATRKITPATLIIFVLLAGLAAGAAVFLLRELGSQGPVNVVVLKSESSSFKQKPEAEPEDKSAGAQSSVMNMLDDIQENKQDIEVIPLKPAAPEMPEVKLPETQTSETQTSETQTSGSEEQSSSEVKTAENQQTDAPSSDDQSNNEDGDSAKDEMKAALDASANNEEEIKPIERPIQPRVITEKATKSPSMMVQLAAFRQQEKAEEVAALLTQKHKDRLQGLTLGVMQADTGSSGIFWRVTTEAIPTEDARGVCDGLKRAGQDCILRKVALQ